MGGHEEGSGSGVGSGCGVPSSFPLEPSVPPVRWRPSAPLQDLHLRLADADLHARALADGADGLHQVHLLQRGLLLPQL